MSGAVEGAFGSRVEYSQLVKIYGESGENEKRYSPAVHRLRARDGSKATPTRTTPPASWGARTSPCG